MTVDSSSPNNIKKQEAQADNKAPLPYKATQLKKVWEMTNGVYLKENCPRTESLGAPASKPNKEWQVSTQGFLLQSLP